MTLRCLSDRFEFVPVQPVSERRPHRHFLPAPGNPSFHRVEFLSPPSPLATGAVKACAVCQMPPETGGHSGFIVRKDLVDVPLQCKPRESRPQ
jgi:hypothetical protein